MGSPAAPDIEDGIRSFRQRAHPRIECDGSIDGGESPELRFRVKAILNRVFLHRLAKLARHRATIELNLSESWLPPSMLSIQRLAAPRTSERWPNTPFISAGRKRGNVTRSR